MDRSSRRLAIGTVSHYIADLLVFYTRGSAVEAAVLTRPAAFRNA